MKRILILLAGMLCLTAGASDQLAKGFVNPPDQTRPWCYWYWISDNISKGGITRDLEAMARVGIGEALIGNIFLDDVPAGKIKVLSPEWWALVEHAMREGGRTGVNIGMFNCPGWSQSGGPWIKPEQAMRYLASSETRVTGPCEFKQKLAAPNAQFQDVAVLAFPAPKNDLLTLSTRNPRVTCTPSVSGAEKLVDGDVETSIQFPQGAGRGKTPFTVDFDVPEAFTARSLRITPSEEAFGADCELQTVASDGTPTTVRRFRCDRSNMSTGVGFMPRGPVTIAIPATTAKKFRLVFTGFFGGKPALAEISLSGAAQLESFVEKQLGKMHPTPLPMWDTYLWKTQAEPDDAALIVPSTAVKNLSQKLLPDGTLEWQVPAGDWIIQRIGMTPTGMKNSPASPEGQGLEVDKMNRALAKDHFNAFIGEILRRVPATERKAFKRVVADSYEMGSQNWTDDLDAQFQKRYGYDPKPWLPVLTGRLVGSADQSERFLWDLRRLVADRVATDYVGGLREACKPHGLGLWLENYGHWGFPSEFLKYGSESDRIGGEYWVTGDLGSIELRAASSCANTYGKKFVSAESFTGGPAFQNAPAALKVRGDWAFCEGVNHFVLHVYIHQPWEDKVPGVNAWFGTEFNRHNTWFEQSKNWVDYVRRSCWMLQQGNRVADVAYFIGEDAPKMTGARNPVLPPGRDFDYINGDVIETSLKVRNGLLVLPHGTTYRVLVLPELSTMTPEVLRKVRDLVKAGATVLGPRPSHSPSLQNFPECDQEVMRLAQELWGPQPNNQPGERKFGRGRILWGISLDEVLGDTPPDFESSAPLRHTHRQTGDADIYFVASPKGESLTTTAAFRAGSKAPELWWPDSGRFESPAVYDVRDGRVTLPLSFGPYGSVFVVFRSKAAPPGARIVAVSRDGKDILETTVDRQSAAGTADSPNNFSFAAWIKPTENTTLMREANQGVLGLGDKRNDVLAAPHGDSFGGSGHAGCGLAVGQNGVCVFEHGANYFVPTLVYSGQLLDWTHVAVVYREGQPNLYLNGVLAHTGLKSQQTVHSGAGAGAQAQFRGQVGGFEQFGRALNDGEVADLARTMSRPDQAGAGSPILLAQRGKHIQATTTVPGNYGLTFADGKRRSLTVQPGSRSLPITGPWEVDFQNGLSAPGKITFDELTDWTRHSTPGVRYYSGKAVYTKRFELPARSGESASRWILDLGNVRDLAAVRLNGKGLGTLWQAPWQVDITEEAKPGENVLEIEVVNVWNNRLVGDQSLPSDQRRTFLLAPTVSKDTPLLPAGLLGPVLLREATVTQLE